MKTAMPSWKGRKSWNTLTDEDVMRYVVKAAERCVAAGDVASIERLRKHGAIGNNQRITEAREQLIASGKLSAEACKGKNYAPRKLAVKAVAVLEAKAASPRPKPEPTSLEILVAIEIRAAMKRERDRRCWTMAAPELAGA